MAQSKEKTERVVIHSVPSEVVDFWYRIGAYFRLTAPQMLREFITSQGKEYMKSGKSDKEIAEELKTLLGEEN